MRVVEIPKTFVADAPLNVAFETAFGKETLARVHGPSVTATEWRNDSRKVRFSVPVLNIPREIRRFFCGDKLRVTATQTREARTDAVRVTNKLRLHFLGGELFKIRATFVLSHNIHGTYIEGTVEHRAYLPPPINAIAEAFMVDNSRREMEHFSSVIS